MIWKFFSERSALTSTVARLGFLFRKNSTSSRLIRFCREYPNPLFVWPERALLQPRHRCCSPDSPINPEDEWERLESSIEDSKPYLNDTESLHRDYFPRVHSQLIAKLERFIRAIALQFTIGGHADQNGRLRQASVEYGEFQSLRGEQLGTIDYRRSVQILRQKQEIWFKRSEQEIVNGKWPTRIVTKAEFGKEWPFRTDRVIVECQENLFCIVNIDGYAFALNGSAQSRFKMPFPHDAGLAVLGKSVGPFIEMAFALRKEAICNFRLALGSRDAVLRSDRRR